MTEPDPDSARFRDLATRAFDFLLVRGFRRVPSDEQLSSVAPSIAYAGRHVGFLVSLDARDDVVSVRVTRARDGRLAPTGPGGYSSDLLSHLVERQGYRGRGAVPGAGPGSEHARMLAAWARLLREQGGRLLEDDAEALTTG